MSLTNRKPDTSYLMKKLAAFNSGTSSDNMQKRALNADTSGEAKTGMEDNSDSGSKTTEVIIPDHKDVTGKELSSVLEEIMDMETSDAETAKDNAVSEKDVEKPESKEESEKKEEDKEEKEEKLTAKDEDMEKESACGQKKHAEAKRDIITLIYHNHLQNAKYAKIADDAALITKLLLIDKLGS